MLLFHGSPKDIKRFVLDFVGQEQAKDQNGPGIYLTTSKQDAEQYGNNIYVIQLLDDVKLIKSKSKKPSVNTLVKLIKMSSDWEMSANNWSENANLGAIEAANAALENNDSAKDVFLQTWIDFYRYRPIDFVKNMVTLGIDGILVDQEHDNVQHVILYNPDKILKVEKLSNSIREFVRKTILDELRKKRKAKKKKAYQTTMKYPYGWFGGFGGNFGADYGGGFDGGDSGGGDGGGGE